MKNKKIKRVVIATLVSTIMLCQTSVCAKGISGGTVSRPSTTSVSRPSTTSVSRPSTPTTTSKPSSSSTTSKPSTPSTPKTSSSVKSFFNRSSSSKPATPYVPKTTSTSGSQNQTTVHYNSYGGYSGNFWSNYWLYRAVSHDHNPYYSNGGYYGGNYSTSAYMGVKSIMCDIITLIIIVTICYVIYRIFKRKRRDYDGWK